MKSSSDMLEKIVLKKYMLIVTILIFTMIIYTSENNAVAVFILYSTGIMAIYHVDFDLLHPYTWFIPFLLLYSTSSAILILNGSNEYLGQDGLNQTLEMSWIALIVFVTVVGSRRIEINPRKVNFSGKVLISKFIYWLSYLFIVIMILYIIASGSVNKADISMDNSMFITLGMYGIHYFILSMTIIIINQINLKKKKNNLMILSALILSIMVIFIAGERDFLLRIIIVLILVYNIFVEKIPTLKLMLMGTSGVFLISFLQKFKNFLITSDTRGLKSDSIIEGVLGGEFISAGRNLQVLVQSDMSYYFSSNPTILKDLRFALENLPFFKTSVVTPTKWFNETFYYNYLMQGGGKGFTLIGEGYINWGYLGVAFIFVLLGLTINFFYRKSAENTNWLIAYIILIPNTVYILRADYGIYLSIILKYILMPILLIIVLEKILREIAKQK